MAVALMAAAHRSAGTRLSPIGLSVLGAAGHAGGQVLVARVLLLRHEGVWLLLPPLLLSSLATGILTGVAAHHFLVLLRQHRSLPPTSAGAT